MKHLKSILSFIGLLVIGFGGGYLIGQLLSNKTPNASNIPLLDIWWNLLLVFGGLAVAAILQIAIHEAGHVVFGLLSGYRFLSYRLLNLHWQKVDGKLKLFHHSLAGTAGQALMIPPQPVNGKIPYVLYNLGGGLANFLTLPICYGLNTLLPQWQTFWEILGFLGIVLGLVNLIPIGGDFPNDGYNIYAIAKHPQGSLYLYSMLAIHAQMVQGRSFDDMAEQLFLQPSKDDLSNPIVFSACLNWTNRLLALNKLEEARDYLNSLAIDQIKLTHIYSVIGRAMQAYLQLLCDQTTTVHFSPKDWKAITALSQSQPAVLVFLYAYHSLVEQDKQKAEQVLSQFEQLEKSYPYPVDYASEKARLVLFQQMNT